MPLDDAARKDLQKAVARIRTILINDFTVQCTGTYGIQPDGTTFDIARLEFRSEEEKTQAGVLRDRLAHLVASIGEENIADAVDRMLREQAFTVLNRLCALRMCEERDLTQECVRNGFDSKGFRLFEETAAQLGDETYQRYSLYLSLLCDELSVELGILFDRFGATAVLFPSESALKDCLGQLNQSSLRSLWAEDETVGWIYQYFNPPEERRAMRGASQAPRNSRELAVRNQFFTPRYVVEFLTDNTLGRIWYEMRQGDTALKHKCHFLVRPLSEIFSDEATDAHSAGQHDIELSQEDLITSPVYVEHRTKKDPRDFRVLDPACGSGHFLLYAFNLLETIYEEAWSDPDCPRSDLTGRLLREDFPKLDDLLRFIPKLIIEHNLHGIDIDQRAVQIAALALWLRAQSAWKTIKIKPIHRPPITKSNVVTAEPMPGEDDMLREFTAEVKPRVLGQLVQVVSDKMKLAGEAGSLLKIEEELTDAISEARAQWLHGPRAEQVELFPDLIKPRPEQQYLRFELAEVTEAEFWQQAEDSILAALRKYVERTQVRETTRRLLFADDAARGFSFIDVCRKRYDVVLTNPPFGQPTTHSKDYIDRTAGAAKADIYTAFLARFTSRLTSCGRLGAITPRSFIYQIDFHDFRKRELLAHRGIPLLVELGFGELDGATNRTAATIITPSRSARDISRYASIADSNDKSVELLRLTHDISSGAWRAARLAEFDLPESSQFLFRFSKSFRDLLSRMPRLDPVLGKAHKGARAGVANILNGLQCPSDFRYVRLAVEVSPADLQSRWFPFLKPIHFAPYVSELACVVNWYAGGSEQKAEYEGNGVSPSKYISGESFYPSVGVWFPDVSERGIGATFISVAAIPGRKGLLALGKPNAGVPSDALAGLLNSLLAEGVLGLVTPERHHKPSYMGQIPWIKDSRCIEAAAAHYWRMVRLASTEAPSELSPDFIAPDLVLYRSGGLRDSIAAFVDACRTAVVDMQSAQDAFDRYILAALSTSESDVSLLKEMSRRADISDWFPTNSSLRGDDGKELVEALLSYVVGVAFGRWDVRAGSAARPPIDRIRLGGVPRQCPPGQLQTDGGLPISRDELDATESHPEGRYPIDVPREGILAGEDDSAAARPRRNDIASAIHAVFDLLWGGAAHEVQREVCEVLGVLDVVELLRRPKGFFEQHLNRYTKSQRKAPIYWPLSTGSGRYTLWLYYHRLTDQTLFTCVNEFIDPKVDEIDKDLDRSNRAEQSDRKERQRRDDLLDLRSELKSMRSQILEIAGLPYKPNLNDGVLINAAPLWPLFRYKPWQVELKDCWEKLKKGQYDWSHMAHNVWPERVRGACRNDKSIAMAHGLESLYEAKEIKKARGDRK